MDWTSYRMLYREGVAWVELPGTLLLPEEAATLADAPRCARPGCGHLALFHRLHGCEVAGCHCVSLQYGPALAPVAGDQEAEDEPVFVLRAHDRLAPALVAIWCELAALHDCPDPTIDAAYVLRNRMLGWQADHGCRWPD